jgi:hypothetical protein
MSENTNEKKEIKLKGVIPAKVSTPVAFREALENLREYNRRSSESFADILEKCPPFLEKLKTDERRMEMASKILVSFINYLEKHPSILEEVMKENEQEPSKQKFGSDC